MGSDMTYFSEEHDYTKYPELSNTDLEMFGFMSPHKQIVEDFEAEVVKVIDGDTIRLKTDFRDFEFPLRLVGIDAPELNTGSPGEEAREFLQGQIEGQIVQVKINRNKRVDKYGRLLGRVFSLGQDVGALMLAFGYALPFERRLEGELPDNNKMFRLGQWF